MNIRDNPQDLFDLEPGRGSQKELTGLAQSLYLVGNRETAATAIDLAFTINPANQEVSALRAEILDSLTVHEHGLTFRYVPGRSYLMGSTDGDPDESPSHVVRLEPYWLSDVPVSWALFCAILDWPAPQDGLPSPEQVQGICPSNSDLERAIFFLREASKIRLQYCEDATSVTSPDWHHAKPGRYEEKPMVAVAWQEAECMAQRLYNNAAAYRLPTEAEWEAGARGGITGAPYPWGSAPPTDENCDFNRYGDFSIRTSRTFPPNDYGLYGMSGGVWEWTSDWYDSAYYSNSPRKRPTGPSEGLQRVLRGGSWADCAGVVTTSFRNSRSATPFWKGEWSAHLSPNIGFRLCRSAASAGEP